MNKWEAAECLGLSICAVERHTAKGRLSVRYQRGAKGDEAVSFIYLKAILAVR